MESQPVDRIHICYSIHDAKGTFSKFAGASMCSVLCNTRSPITIHLLHDNSLDGGNRDRFLRMARQFGQEICFYNLEELQPDLLRHAESALGSTSSRFSLATFYRLLMGSILPPSVPRVIYLDADTVVHMDIRRLWEEPVGRNGFAAVSEDAITHHDMVPKFLCQAGIVPLEAYFNAGVLLADMGALRARGNLLLAGIDLLARYPRCKCHDQDVLNYFFARDCRHLDGRYNTFVVCERRQPGAAPAEKIYHYAGNCLGLDAEEPFNRIFYQYFVQSPWNDMEFLSRAFAGVRRIQRDRTLLLRRMANLFSRKRRAAIGLSRYEEQIRRALELRDGEPYISERNMQEFRLETGMVCVFFTGDYESSRDALIQEGYREWEDFVDGRELLACDEEGAPWDDFDVFAQW